MHPTLPDVVARLSALSPVPELSLTTNGVGLDRSARKLADAGLRSDQHLAGHPRPAALRPLDPPRSARRRAGRDRGRRGRRPVAAQDQLGADARRERRRGSRAARLGAAKRVRAALHRAHAARRRSHLGPRRRWSPPRRSSPCSGPTTRWRRATGARMHPPRSSTSSTARTATRGPLRRGGVGVIASVTRPFCRDCDRLRLTADGQLRTCLFAHERDRPARPAARRRVRRRLDRAHRRRGRRQAGRARHRRSRLRPARPPDVGHRRLTFLIFCAWRWAPREQEDRRPGSADWLTGLPRRRRGMSAPTSG